MEFFNLDYLIVISYLLAMLVVGVLVGRNITTLKDYAIANKHYSTPVLMLTMMATMMGGGTTTGNTSMIYTAGIIWVITASSFVISVLIVAKILAPRFDGRFEGMLSSGDIMKYFFGNTIEKFASMACIFACILITTAQLIALGHAFNVFLGLDYKWGVILAGGTLILYSAFGGIKSVTITDVIQFAILIVMVPIIASVAINSVGGVGATFAQIPASHLRVFDHPDFIECLAIFLLELMPFTLLSFPSTVQRFLMAKNTKQISLITTVYAILHFVILLAMMCIAFAAVIKYPDIEPKAVIPTVVNDLLPTGIKGLATVGMLAVIMSTADSFLNTATVFLMKNFGLGKRMHGKNLVLTSRLSTLIIGLLVMYIALMNYSIIDLLVLVEFVLIVTVSAPMFFGIMRLKVDRYSYWANILVAGVALLLCRHYKIPHFITALVVPVVGIITFLVAHFIINKKINILLPFEEEANKKIKIHKQLASKTRLADYLSFNSILNYSAQAVERYGADYILFGAFCSINYILPYFMWTYDQSSNYLAMLMLRIVSGFLCVGLLLKDHWPSQLRKYLPLYWHISLMVCLPFSTTAMFLINHASYEWLINVAFSVMLLIALVDWRSFIGIMLFGMTSGFLYYEFFITDALNWNLNSTQIYLATYSLLFAIVIGFLFIRRKEIYNEERIKDMQLFGSAIAHEVKNPLSAVYSNAETAVDIIAKAKVTLGDTQATLTIPKADFDAMMKFMNNTVMVSKKGIKMVEVLLQSLKNKVDASDIDKHSVLTCINNALNLIAMDEAQKKRISVHNSEVTDFYFYGSKVFIEHVFVNLCKNALQHAGKNAQITITIKRNIIEIYDNGYGISEDKLPLIFHRFYSANEGTGIGLAFCKMVMDELGGSIECDSELGKYTKFVIQFPYLET
jgi:Na+/proline symporter/signal transduction histidine kinase